MEIKIAKKAHLYNGELCYEELIEFNTNKPVTMTIQNKWNDEENITEKIIYVQIGNMLNKDFKEYEITEKDMIWIR